MAVNLKYFVILWLATFSIFKSDLALTSDWVQYSSGKFKGQDLQFFYDKDSTIRPSPGTLRTWIRVTVDPNPHIPKNEGLSFSEIKILMELNCKNKMTQRVQSIYYDHLKDPIQLSDPTINKWEYIIPGSVEDNLYQILCPSTQ